MKTLAVQLSLIAVTTVVTLPLKASLVQSPQVSYQSTPYNGRFTFIRLRFEPLYWRPGNYAWGLDLKWNHDYPRAERNFMEILDELTYLRPNMGGGNILSMDDGELFKYPWAYLCEVGYWTLSEEEAKSLRAYLLKGGFLVVDDFIGDHWFNFEDKMRMVLPEGRLVRLDVSHPIFDSFFHIETLEFEHPTFPGLHPIYYGIFEDNDPAKRLMVIVNYNHDIGDYWEW
ncbi:MAG: DUF4159 domain-containing protein, partial [Acidobacteriota bacterium]